MAAFSYQHHPFLHDSLFLPNTSIKISDFSQQPNNPTTCFSQFYPYEPLQGTPLDVGVHKSSCLGHDREVAPTKNNQPSLTDKHSTDSSSVVDKLGGAELVTQKMTSMDKKRKKRDGSSSNSAQSKYAREVKGDKHKQCNGVIKDVEEKKPKADKKDQKKVPEEAPTGYIHVRARRGQATDSHSLAERVRREKISERMKLLQSLVPGCDKVIGKALMLDEIINYVQSLQNQVEFLSMKLASLNPILFDYGVGLDPLMVRPDQRLSGLTSVTSPLANVQQCIPAQVTALSDTTTTFTTASNHNTLLDTSSSLLFQQRQMPNIHSQPQRHNAQDNGQLLWDVDEQRQKIINQPMFSNLCAFH